MTASFVVLTGASGAGKTTLAEHIRVTHPACHVFFFDSVGVPSLDEMECEYGSGEQWQRAMTLDWIARIKPLLSSERPVLFEGQMRIAFIQGALAEAGVSGARVVLVDCDDAARVARLSTDRDQPDLVHADMMRWARYLRDEAAASGIEIVDTSVNPFDGCVQYLVERLGLTRSPSSAGGSSHRP